MTDEFKAAVKTAFAATLLEALDGPRRDAILVEAVAEGLKDWQFRKELNDLVRFRARDRALAVIESGAYDDRIDAAIREGFDGVLAKLPAAVGVALKAALFGRQGEDNYDNHPGIVLSHLD